MKLMPCAVALGLSTLASVASADPQSVTIEVRGTDTKFGYELEDYRTRGQRWACAGDCAFAVPPGRYRLRIIEPDGRRLDSHVVNVEAGARWYVSPPDKTAAGAGLAMGVTGIALAAGGAIAASVWLLNAAGCSGGDCKQNAETFQIAGTIGLFALAGGAVMIPVGWSQWARHHSSTLRVEPGLAAARLRLGVAPISSGLALAAAYDF